MLLVTTEIISNRVPRDIPVSISVPRYQAKHRLVISEQVSMTPQDIGGGGGRSVMIRENRNQ